jgi:hypothetical protein
MDLSALKARLSGLQNPKGEMKKTLWSPSVGKHSVRILPSAFDKKNPFKELYFHYSIGNKTMIALSNFGEADPIVEFTQKLRRSSNKEDWALAKKLEPRLRIYAPVIVRGEEDKGVLLWGFGKTVYMDLLSIANDEDVQDYTDPLQGRDITIETLGKETTGKDFNSSSIRVRTKITPLSENSEEAKKWLTNQPNPIEQFSKVSYEDMKTALLNYLNPEEEAPAQEEEEVNDLPFDVPPAKSFSLNTSKPAVDSRIDQLFDF